MITLNRFIEMSICRNIKMCEYMGQLNVSIPDDLERRFRELAAKKFGFKKGALSKAVEEAIRDWVEKNERKLH